MDYSKMSDFEINKRVAIALDIDMHFYIPESEDSFQPGFLPTELGPIWQTSAGLVGEFTVSNGNMFNPCNSPSDAWPIISANRISVEYDSEDQCDVPCEWVTAYGIDGLKVHVVAHQPCDKALRSAMIVFLMLQEKEKYAGAAK